jgi:hypothetical protein
MSSPASGKILEEAREADLPHAVLQEEVSASPEDDEEIVEDGIYGRTDYLSPSSPPPLQLFANGGHVPTGAAEAAGLTETELDHVERATRAMWKQFATLFNQALAVDREASSPELITLKAKAFPQAAKAVIAELEKQIDAATDPEKAGILKSIAYLPPSFGQAGRHHVLIEYSPSKGSYYYEYRDPKTGKTILSGTSGMDHFHSQFGDQIDLDRLVESLHGP